MSRVNIEIPDDLHDNLRDESDDSGTPIKYLIIDALDNEFGSEQERDDISHQSRNI
ncbi:MULTISPECIES: hypothetical protein [Halobacterium]|uniref:hypothetical protein n=1 Tax=Halobacterium TaxID=2239 RepID=UPI000ABF19D7|nr:MULTISPECIES: hypothetical protein [Halobacterium]MCG1001910.1 hypothetical protein [Halobacterium noricense]